MSLCGLERFRSMQNLLLAVVAVGVGAAAVAVVDGAGGGHVQLRTRIRHMSAQHRDRGVMPCTCFIDC